MLKKSLNEEQTFFKLHKRRFIFSSSIKKTIFCGKSQHPSPLDINGLWSAP